MGVVIVFGFGFAVGDLGDVVTPRNGPKLVGVVLGKDAKGRTHLLLERADLDAALPKWPAGHALVDADAKIATVAVVERLRTRIAAWIERRAEHKDLVLFLRERLRQLDQQVRKNRAAQPAPTPLVAIAIPPAEIRSIRPAPLDSRAKLLTAWRHDVVGAARKSKAELEMLKGKPAARLPELVGMWPPRPQDDAEWAARVAVVEHEYMGPLAMKFLAGTAVEGDDLAGGLGAIQRMLESQLGGGKPVDPNEVDRTAIKKAESVGRVGVLVTDVPADLVRQSPRVGMRFLAKGPSGWRTLWSASAALQANAAEAKGAMEGIEADPRLGGVLKMLGGLVDGEALANAKRMGAGLQLALAKADAEWKTAAADYLDRLDGPPLLFTQEPRR